MSCSASCAIADSPATKAYPVSGIGHVGGYDDAVDAQDKEYKGPCYQRDSKPE